MLRYPEDAEAHFDEIHRRMARWSQPPGWQPHQAAGFHGPWVENLWIEEARRRNHSRAQRPSFGPWQPVPLGAVFGPFIPLLFTWVDVWVFNSYSYPKDFLQELNRVLRHDVPYVTVSQNDEGITGKCELRMEDWPNILVFSSGGYGHVPIPLFQQEYPMQPTARMEDRRYLISYVGSLEHAPGDLRNLMKAALQQQSKALNFSATTYYGPDWVQVMAESCVSLVPRGFGRTAYHLAEVIHMGYIPLYVFSDVPWIPYRQLFRKFGYSVNITRLPHLLALIGKTPRGVFVQREKHVAMHRHLFLPAEVIKQVFRFLAEPQCDLQCVLLPKTPKGDRSCRT